MTKLTDQQELFCREYIKDLNATQSAIRAGYSERTADVQGCRLLGNDKVASRISELKAQRVDEVRTDANYVLKRLLEIDSLDIADILDDQGNLKPISLWPKEWRTSIDAFDIISIKSNDLHTSAVKSVRMPNKLKNLELLGKHIDVSAFKERLELTGKNGNELVITVTSNDTKKGLEMLKENLE